MNRIVKVEINLADNGHFVVSVTKEFAPQYGGGTEVFQEDGGVNMHRALDVARGMVTFSPARRSMDC